MISITEVSAILARELAYGVPKKHWHRYASLRKELDECLFALIDNCVDAEPQPPEPKPTATVQPQATAEITQG